MCVRSLVDWRSVLHAKDPEGEQLLRRYAVRKFDFTGHGSRGGAATAGSSAPDLVLANVPDYQDVYATIREHYGK